MGITTGKPCDINKTDGLSKKKYLHLLIHLARSQTSALKVTPKHVRPILLLGFLPLSLGI